MPKVDGWTVLSAMQGDASLRAIPVIVLSTSSRMSDQTRALSLRARSYLIKPLVFQEWVQELQSALAVFLPAKR
jgi:CheY-like chemotaxis protein